VSKVKNTKKVKSIKKDEKDFNIDESLVEILVGSMLICTSDFNDGIWLEKFVVLFGFVTLLVGIFRALPKYKKQNKKGMVIILFIVGVVVIITLLGLVLRLFGGV
jgi:hypothetical protein